MKIDLQVPLNVICLSPIFLEFEGYCEINQMDYLFFFPFLKKIIFQAVLSFSQTYQHEYCFILNEAYVNKLKARCILPC